MHREFLPQDLDDMLYHIVEECSEVLKAVAKIKRFGPYSTWPPGNPSNNLNDLIDEAEDVRLAVQRFAAKIATIDLLENPRNIEK